VIIIPWHDYTDMFFQYKRETLMYSFTYSDD